MADIKSPEERSRNMAAIRSKDTSPELYLRKQLFRLGIRYRVHSDSVPGHPDLWLKKYNSAIFVHGCYWHRHSDCKFAYSPKSNVDFWEKKFSANVLRDQTVYASLKSKGIKTLVIWECTVTRMARDTQFKQRTIDEMLAFLKSQDIFKEL